MPLRSVPAHIGMPWAARNMWRGRAAALVLLDDDFGAISKAISLGRRIFTNLPPSDDLYPAVHVPIIGLSILPCCSACR